MSVSSGKGRYCETFLLGFQSTQAIETLVAEVFVTIIAWTVRLYKKAKLVKGDLKLLISLVFDTPSITRPAGLV